MKNRDKLKESLIKQMSNGQLLPIDRVSIRFFLKVRKCINTGNGNGYGYISLEWGFFRSRGSFSLYHFKIGNGNTGANCQ